MASRTPIRTRSSGPGREWLSCAGFYIHATVFILVNLFLLAVNLLTTPHFLWFFFPLLGWGIGLVIHGLTMFSSVGVFGRDWEERKVREYLEQERRR